MILKIVLVSLVVYYATAQRQYLRNTEEADEEDYIPPTQYQTRPNRRSDLFNPASVHYVNIGEKLEGDYKFGYDTGKREDGQSFREETRLPDGTVRGAYGYVDETGTRRVVRYTAGKDGYKVEGDPASERAGTRPAPRAVQRPPPQPTPIHHQQPQPAPVAPQPVYRQSVPVQRPPPNQGYAPRQTYPVPVNRGYDYERPTAPRPQPELRNDYPERSMRTPVRQSHSERPIPKDYDYDEYSDNEIPVRNVPVDTSLFNYNIGANQNSRS